MAKTVIDSTPKAIDDSGEGPSFVRKSSSLGVGQHEVVTAMVEKVVEQSHALIESHVQDNVHEPSPDSPRERIIDESRNKSPMVLELAHPNRFQQLVIHEQDDASENGSENVIELKHSDEEMLAARVVLEVVLDVSKQKQNDQEHNGSSGGASMDAINSGTEVYDSECELSSPTQNVSTIPINSWYEETEREPKFTVVAKSRRKSSREASKVENREAYIRRSKVIP